MPDQGDHRFEGAEGSPPRVLRDTGTPGADARLAGVIREQEPATQRGACRPLVSGSPRRASAAERARGQQRSQLVGDVLAHQLRRVSHLVDNLWPTVDDGYDVLEIVTPSHIPMPAVVEGRAEFVGPSGQRARIESTEPRANSRRQRGASMTFSVGLRRFTYTAHLTASVGWLGAVLVFIAIASIGLSSRDERIVRGAYLIMAPAAWLVLVPLAHASLVSGIALSLGTPWGLIRHYWVALKLGITVFATVILMIYMGTFKQMAGVAADPIVEMGLVRNPSPLVHASLALVLLIAATVLAVYKPFCVTPYGERTLGRTRLRSVPTGVARAHEELASHNGGWSASRRSWSCWWVIALAAVVLLLAAHFLLGGSHGR